MLSDVGVIIERFTLADVNTLDYRMTVNDPKNWTALWTMRMPTPREDSYGFYEYACHEGNYAMTNLLSGFAVWRRNAAPKRRLAVRRFPWRSPQAGAAAGSRVKA